MTASSSGDRILVVGGYGVVGRRIAARLAPELPGRVVIAGRDESKAQTLCRELGHGSSARRIDVDEPGSMREALAGIGTIVMCVAQRQMYLLRAASIRGLAYTDIAPRLAFWQGAEEMTSEAHRTGARIVLGAGLSPGISNMMAAQLAKTAGRVDSIETAILLSLGDEYGPDSLNHVLDSITRPFTVLRDGVRQDAVPFAAGRRVVFSEPLGSRMAYLFPWSDVVHYPKTLGARTSIGRLALEPRWAGKLAELLVGAGARRWLTRGGVLRGHRRAIDRLKEVYRGRDRFALVVTVEAGPRTYLMRLAGRHQANATADSAAELARALAAREIDRAGVWLPEQIVPHERFFERLAAHGWMVQVENAQEQC